MELTDRFEQVSLDRITVVRDDRQRRIIDTVDLQPSIRQFGILNPLILDDSYCLVAGERRLEAARAVGLLSVPCRFLGDLSPVERQLIELEENVKRKDLPWRDHCRAVETIHRLYVELDPKWNITRTAQALGFSPNWTSEVLRVARDLEDPRVLLAGTLRAAVNLLIRRDERLVSDAMNDISEGALDLIPDEADDEGCAEGAFAADLFLESAQPAGLALAISGEPGTAQAHRPRRSVLPEPVARVESADASILAVDFLSWAPAYAGPKFNLVHCDFPYGVNVFRGGQANTAGTAAEYVDTVDVYWALLEAFCHNLDRFMTPSAHLVFWFSMEHFDATLRAFRLWAPSLDVQAFPLVWLKSDNVGMVPDPKRAPRRVYETALLASREDRFIIKPLANAYSAPTDKTLHPSTKPEPMLRHFFSMLVDEHTRMLDPTCGSGSALRAAESLGAKHVLGLERDADTAVASRIALREFRLKRSIAK